MQPISQQVECQAALAHTSHEDDRLYARPAQGRKSHGDCQWREVWQPGAYDDGGQASEGVHDGLSHMAAAGSSPLATCQSAVRSRARIRDGGGTALDPGSPVHPERSAPLQPHLSRSLPVRQNYGL